MAFQLKIITSTVRTGRKGPIIAGWIAELARQNGNFDVEVLDLGEVKLPMMDEPNHPTLRKYVHEHTRNWSASIEKADVFIFVTSEYNNNYPAPLRNAMEYLIQEWAYKAAGIVSYGGVSAGTRGANSLKGDLASLKMVPLTEAVHLPFFTQYINAEGQFIASEISIKAATTMLRELVRWTHGLKLVKENRF